MPYGLNLTQLYIRIRCSFNPSYGLHALRAGLIKCYCTLTRECFNPSYGLHALRAGETESHSDRMSCFNPSYGLHALRAEFGRATPPAL